MSLQFGPTKIGAMQYNGVTIGEAMMDGQIVYRSVLPDPYNYGAKHWLRFTSIPYADAGHSPAAWTGSDSPTVSGGYLSSGRVQIPASSFNTSAGFSATVWVNMQYTSGIYSRPLYIGTSGNGLRIRVQGSTGEVALEVRNPDSYTYPFGLLPYGSWVFLAVTVTPDGGDWTIKVFLDGIEALSQNVVQAAPLGGDIRVVSSTATTVNFVDEAAFYEHALSPSQVAALYEAGRGGE